MLLGIKSKFLRRLSSARNIIILVALAALFLPGDALARRIDSDKKYSLMAVWVINSFFYVEWPALVVDSDERKNIDLCFFGEDPFGSKIDEAADKASAKSKIVINLRRDVEIQDVKTCNAAFVSDAFAKQGALFEEIAKYPIFSITEESDEMEKHGVIEFYTKKTVLFRINNIQAELQNLKIKSSLLKLASEVKR